MPLSPSSPFRSPRRSRRVRATGRAVRMLAVCGLALTFLLSGCGTTALRTATDQMLASDAVDQAVSRIDFSPLAEHKVYLDPTYLQPVANIAGIGFVNASYIASALRQHLLASGVLLVEKADQAELIVEARVGILGADRHDLTYGMPSSAGGLASTAATAATQVPIVIPEISLARKVDQVAAAKIACYAYNRDSRERVWQSGTSLARSNSKDTWILGMGPFQKTTLQEEVKFAGEPVSPFKKSRIQKAEGEFDRAMVFRRRRKVEESDGEPDSKAETGIQQAAASTPQESAKPATPPTAGATPAPAGTTTPAPVTEAPNLQPVPPAAAAPPVTTPPVTSAQVTLPNVDWKPKHH